MFQDKSLLAVAEAVKKVWAEALTDKQKKIDKNHNNKIDGQDLAILRKEEAKKPVSPFDWKNTPRQTREKGELSGHTSKKISTGTEYTKKYVKEDDTGYQDRFAVKDGKAVKNNPERGERDQAHHVWADSEEHAVRKHAKMNKVKTEGFDPLKHIKNPSLAVKAASKDVKRGSYADRAALMKAGGVKDDRGPRGVTQEEASQAEFTAELKKAQAKSQGKEKADVAKPAVQAVQNEHTHTQVEVFDLNDANGVKRSVIDLEEAKSGYDLYHSMYSGAIQHGLAHHEKSGLKVDPDDYHDKVTVGQKKPSEGKTVSHNIKATNAKGEPHMIHMQVYNKGGDKPYELNTYSSKVSKKQVKEEVDEQSNNDWPAEKEKIRSMSTTQRRGHALARYAATNDSKYAHIASKAGAGHSEIMNARKGKKEVDEGIAEDLKNSQVKENSNLKERHLTSAESDKMEKNVKSMKKGLAGFKERYGKDAKSVMYATATKQAKGE